MSEANIYWDMGTGAVEALVARGPEEDDLHVRQSTFESMKLCPARVGQAHMEGFLSTPSEAMAFGSLTHEVIATFLQGDRGEVPLALYSPPFVRDLLRGIAEADGYDLDEVAPSDVQLRMAEEAVHAFRLWHAEVWLGHGLSRAEVAFAEERKTRLLGEIGDRRVWFHGTPDLVLADEVIDWKTSGREWRVSKDGVTKGAVSLQAPTYLWLVQPEVGWIDEFTFWVYDRSKSNWSPHPTLWSKESIEAALINAFELSKMIDAGAYPFTPGTDDFGTVKRGWHCSPQYCGAWNICKGKASLTDGYDLSIVASESQWT